MTDEKAVEKMLYDQQQGWPLCPRCGERMPDKLTHGALSRHAKGVYICEACGTDEALRDWAALYKSRSFSSASILHGTHAAVKTFCPVLRS